MTTNIQPHIRCGKDIGIKYALLPGNPGRIERIKTFLDNPSEIASNREYKSIAGTYKGIKVMALSTGIGGPSTGIAVEELNNIGVKTLIRIGSCGALQMDMKLGELVIASGAVRNDGTSDTYIEKGYPAVPDTGVLMNVLKSAEELKYRYHCGIIRSHDSFYTDNEDAVDKYWSNKRVLAADMESAALFVIGSLRGLKTASILNVVVESDGKIDNINDYVDGESSSMKGEGREIITALEAIVKLEKI